jgi:putative ABC transport system permease protein
VHALAAVSLSVRAGEMVAGTSAPSTVITEHAVHALGEQLVPGGWLIQTATPLTAGQVSIARQAAAKAGIGIETSTGQPSGAQLKDGAIAAGLLGALLGTATAYLAVTAWAHASLATTLYPVPTADLAAILAGLPLAAAVAGGLLAGRQPPTIARQPLE